LLKLFEQFKQSYAEHRNDSMKQRMVMLGLAIFLMWWGGGSASAQNAKEEPMAKLAHSLLNLHEQYTTHLTQRSAVSFSSSDPIVTLVDQRVVVDAVASGDPNVLKADLESLGMQQAVAFGRIVSGQLPVSAIPAAAHLASLRFARSAVAVTSAGAVTSQGDAALRSDTARANLGVNGAGITVGVLSNSFNCLGGAANDITNGDLSPVTVIQEISNCTTGTDEGRAMLQIVHDVAPGANLAFASALNGMASYATNIQSLAAAGAKVIADDVLYLAEPMFQDGIVAQAVNQVVGGGVAFFSAAGNQGRFSYESAFRPGMVFGQGAIASAPGAPFFFGGTAHNFDTGGGTDVFQRITLPNGGGFLVSFQWDSPAFSVSGGAGSPNDLDIYVLNAGATQVLAGSVSGNISASGGSGDPVEVFAFVNNTGATADFNILITNFQGPNPVLMKYVLFSFNGTIQEFPTNSRTIYGHINAAGAEAVGAARYTRTPAFGVSPPELESFSSSGGTPILFDTAGNRLTNAEIGSKPEIVAPDGGDTTFFGTDTDGNGFPNFFGTSAAAPHAAGVAALLLQAKPGSTPLQIYAGLENTAIDMGASGFDYDSGFGLIQADAALAIAPISLSISINDATVSEGNTGTTNAVFTVSLSSQSTHITAVNFSTADNTAAAGSDYVTNSGTLIFNPGETTKTITVLINGDTLAEADETFFVNLSNPLNATMGDGQGLGTIINDDALPSISINDVSTAEANTGTTNAVFTITLSSASSQTVSVNFSTADGTATAGSDYLANSGTLTFNPGETTKNITVLINGDSLTEGNETFFVNLNNPMNATIADGQGQITIIDNDLALPAISINDATVSEGNTGTTNAVFTVSLSSPSSQTVTTSYSTTDGNAIAGTDYVAAAGVLTFNPGETSKTITVLVNGDTTIEGNETFFLNLTSATHASIADGQGIGTILDDDSAPAVRLGNISTRSRVLTGDNVMIGGFIIDGLTPLRVFIRSRGPSMGGAPFFVPGTLANPLLRLFSGQTVIAQNDNWQDSPSCSGFPCESAAQMTSTSLDPCQPNPTQSGPPPNCNLESAVLITLPPGAYTAIVTGSDGGTGVGLVEVFEADDSTEPELTNISTRGFVQSGDNVMIGGIIIEGSTESTVLIRARAPSMAGAPFFVPGTLANPFLQLYSGQTLIAQNNDWQDAASCPGFTCGGATQITATGLDPCQPNPGQSTPPPGCAQESAMLITLPPGAYTAIVSGADGGTGVGLVEVFEVK
jgi:Calx-beta domain/Subtilase family